MKKMAREQLYVVELGHVYPIPSVLEMPRVPKPRGDEPTIVFNSTGTTSSVFTDAKIDSFNLVETAATGGGAASQGRGMLRRKKRRPAPPVPSS